MEKPSVYISIDGVSPGWIVGMIGRDVQKSLIDMGYECRLGSPDGYQNEDICHHMGYAYAIPRESAKINSVFVTHIDDSMKERELMSLKEKFDLFVAMSSQDRDYMVGIGFEEGTVLDVLLPVRKPYVKAITIGIFSACYFDGRKNEDWILDFCKKENLKGLVDFVFIGSGWGRLANSLAKLNCSFEWHFTSSKMEYEYEFQRAKLASLDYYMYMGFDGGAMGSLDAYGYGRKLILAGDSYHLDIPDVDFLIDSRESFLNVLEKICEKQMRRVQFFRDNTADVYTKKLLVAWASLMPDLFPSLMPHEKNSMSVETGASITELVKLKRSRYNPLTWFRVLGSIRRSLIRLLG